MAKSKSFFGLRKGSTKTMTYSVLRGQQITKDRVTDIANPRTMNQTLQRIPFAQAVKFYKQATKGLFRFAFEDKRPLESDYNAFMRHNVKYASSVSLTNYNDPNYPAIGNWLLADGSLPQLNYGVGDTDSLFLSISTATSAVTTVGDLTPLILSNYNLVEGDIITFVVFISDVFATGLHEEDTPTEMRLIQFVLDSSSQVTLNSLDLSEIAQNGTSLVYDAFSSDKCCAGAVIASRQTPDGLKVSPSQIAASTAWSTIMENKATKVARQGDAISWGSVDKAILQGALSD